MLCEEFSPIFHDMKGENNIIAGYVSRLPFEEKKGVSIANSDNIGLLMSNLKINLPTSDLANAASKAQVSSVANDCATVSPLINASIATASSKLKQDSARPGGIPDSDCLNNTKTKTKINSHRSELKTKSDGLKNFNTIATTSDVTPVSTVTMLKSLLLFYSLITYLIFQTIHLPFHSFKLLSWMTKQSKQLSMMTIPSSMIIP